MGYKLEVPPMFPGISAGVLNNFGDALRREMAALPHTNAMLALLRDGFVPDSPGGRVRVADDGSPVLEYALSDYVWDGVRRAWLSALLSATAPVPSPPPPARAAAAGLFGRLGGDVLHLLRVRVSPPAHLLLG